MTLKTEICNYKYLFLTFSVQDSDSKKKNDNLSFEKSSSNKQLVIQTLMKELNPVVLGKSEKIPQNHYSFCSFWYARIIEGGVRAKIVKTTDAQTEKSAIVYF